MTLGETAQPIARSDTAGGRATVGGAHGVVRDSACVVAIDAWPRLRHGVGAAFFAIVFVQAFTKAGFDLRRAPLSLLSLGDFGWIQSADFVGAGLLGLACAAGVRTTPPLPDAVTAVRAMSPTE